MWTFGLEQWLGCSSSVPFEQISEEHQSLHVRTIIHKSGSQGLQYQRHLCLKTIINGKQIVAPRSLHGSLQHTHLPSLKPRGRQPKEITMCLLLATQKPARFSFRRHFQLLFCTIWSAHSPKSHQFFFTIVCRAFVTYQHKIHLSPHSWTPPPEPSHQSGVVPEHWTAMREGVQTREEKLQAYGCIYLNYSKLLIYDKVYLFFPLQVPGISWKSCMWSQQDPSMIASESHVSPSLFFFHSEMNFCCTLTAPSCPGMSQTFLYNVSTLNRSSAKGLTMGMFLL